MQVPEMSRREAKRILDMVLHRAATDAAFRKGLLVHPKEVIAAEFGMQLPEDIDIRFVERGGEDFTIVLPDLRDSGEADES